MKLQARNLQKKISIGLCFMLLFGNVSVQAEQNSNLNTRDAPSIEDSLPIVNLADNEEDILSIAKSKSIYDLGISRSTDFNLGWKFYRNSDGTSPAGAENMDFDDSSWRQLDLPHDWSIELDFNKDCADLGEAGFLDGGLGWYRKTFTLPQSMKGKKINIHFEGVYMNSNVYVNGNLVGNYPNGYLPFSYDITDLVKTDGVSKNVIAVQVENKLPTSRWYSGSGIYRNVMLVVTDNIHTVEYSTAIKTPNVETEISTGKVNVNVKSEVKNDNDEDKTISVKRTIYDSENNIIGENKSDEIFVAAHSSAKVEQTVTANNPKLWDNDNPNMYKMVTEIMVDEKLVDITEDRFGFRWFSATPNDGFKLNGKYMKLHGVCMHHDQGSLGSVQNYTALDRQMRIMKEMGVNAIRVTHSPASSELIKICEDRGLLVIDELLDGWWNGKHPNDYYRLYLEKTSTAPDATESMTWLEYDLKKMVKRGVNSPAIFAWSVGNEVWEVNVKPKAVTWINNMNKWVDEIDTERWVTMGDDKFRSGDGSGAHEDVNNELDIVGGNYVEGNYDNMHAKHPDWIIYGSETSSATKSRGVYTHIDSLGVSHQHMSPTLNQPYQQSSADNDHVSWGATATNAWKADRDRKYILGEFVWTGFDYIGEATPWHREWPPKSSYFGIVDTAGFVKDDYYLYQSQWLDSKTNPMVHILPHWNWEDKKLVSDLASKDGKIPVRVYSNAAKVELFLNGVSQGEKSFISKTTSDGRTYQEGPDLTGSAYNTPLYLEWRLNYTPGEIKAVAKDSTGKQIASDVIKTASSPAKLQLSTEKTIIDADGYDLCYVTVDVVDKDGNFVPTADNLVNFKISGNGKIVGVDNGNPVSHERFKDTKRKAFNGKCLVIVQSKRAAGSFTLSASSEGLVGSSVTGYAAESNGSGEEILGYNVPLVIQVEKGVMPVLPDKIDAIYSNGDTKQVDMTWNTNVITEEMLNTVGTFEVTGETSTGVTITVTILVKGIIGSMTQRVVTAVGIIPEMPEKIILINNDGSEKEVLVTWDNITQQQVSKVGIFEVNGTISENTKKVKAIVRVTDNYTSKIISVKDSATDWPKTNASYNQGYGHNFSDSIIDGSTASRPAWNNWIDTDLANAETDWIEIEFDMVKTITGLGIYYYTDSQTKLPTKLEIKSSTDGNEYTSLKVLNDGFTPMGTEHSVIFDEPVNSKYVRLYMTGQANGSTTRPVGLTEVFVTSKELEISNTATLKEIKIDNKSLENFNPNVFSYNIDLKYGDKIPLITATADNNASCFVVPGAVEGDPTYIKVISEDGKTKNTYTLESNKLPAGIKTINMTTGKNEYTVNDLIDTNITITMEDGKVLKPQEYSASYKIDSKDNGAISIIDGKIYASKEGIINLKADIVYNDKNLETNAVNLTIKPDTQESTALSYSQPIVEVKKGQKPILPESILAQFDRGIPKNVSVVWDEFPEEFSNKYGIYYLQGSVEGQVLKPTAQIKVKDVVLVEQFQIAAVPNQIPDLPTKVALYYSDGITASSDVLWENVDVTKLVNPGDSVEVKGSVNGTDKKASAKITVSENVTQGRNIAQQWTGSAFPAAIAWATNDQGSSSDRVTAVNDGTIDFETGNGGNRWTDWNSDGKYKNNWVGVLFANSGTITKKYVDNMSVGFYDDGGVGAPKSYTIEYFTPQTLDEMYFPTDASVRAHMENNTENPLAKDENWAPVANVTVENGETYIEPVTVFKENKEIDKETSGTAIQPESVLLEKNQREGILPAGKMIKFNFNTVRTYAIRINMQRQDLPYKGLAITEMQVHAAEVSVKNAYTLNSIKLDGVAIDGFNADKTDYTITLKSDKVPEINVDVTDNASVNIVETDSVNGTAKIFITAEDGKSQAKTYTIKFIYDSPEKNIIEVVQPTIFETPLNAVQGMSKEEVLNKLPKEIDVKLDTNQQVKLGVNWNMSNYNPSSLKTQVIEGDIILVPTTFIQLLKAVNEIYYNPANLKVYGKITKIPSDEYKNIIVNDVVGGKATVKADQEYAKSGETVNVIISDIESGKIFDNIKVNTSDNVLLNTKTEIQGSKYSFIMPDKDVSVIVTLKDAGNKDEYSININPVIGGTAVVNADKSSAKKGDLITVTINNIEQGKKFSQISVKTSEGEKVSTQEITPNEKYSFIMPDKNVLIDILLSDTGTLDKYKVVLVQPSNNIGVMTSNKQEASAGEVIEVNFTDIKEGIIFAGLKVTDNNNRNISVTTVLPGLKYSFAMPSSDVKVEALQKDDTVKYKISNKVVNGSADINTSEQEASAGKLITVFISNIKSGMKFKTISVNDSEGNKIPVSALIQGVRYSFTMPSKDIMITVTLTESNTSSSSSSSSLSSSGGSSFSASKGDKLEIKTDEKEKDNTPDATDSNTNNKSLTMFSDINGHWAKNAIEYVVEQKLFSGISNTEFAPNQNMTRGMFVTVLGRLYGLETDASNISEMKFTDVDKTMYYAPYIVWANENKIAVGMNSDIFNPDVSITREQMAVMFANYSKPINIEFDNSSIINEFKDNDKISSWAKESVNLMQQMQILSGRPDNTFDPHGTATRAEVASVIERFDKINK